MKHLQSLLEAEVLQQELLPLSARLVDLGLDAYLAGYHVAAEHLFHLAERMMEEPRGLR